MGLHDPRKGRVHLRNRLTTGRAQVGFDYGPKKTRWPLLSGDGNSDGVDTVGIYDPEKARFHMARHNRRGTRQNTVQFQRGSSQRIPLTGNWDGK